MSLTDSVDRWTYKRLVVEQTRSHLIFGFFYRTCPFSYVAIPLFLALLVFYGAHQQYELSAVFGINLVLFAVSAFDDRRKQAIDGWIGLKFGLGVASVLCIIAGVWRLVNGRDLYPTVVLLSLGLVMMPGPEFVEPLAPAQKWMTGLRICYPLFLFL